MARVRLNAGGLTAAQVRMGSPGASERVRPPGDDINTGDGRDRSLACALCGGHKKVYASRPRRCGPCRADEDIVRDATARLAAAKQRPLGAKAPGHDYAKLRREGDQARARLAERRKARPQAKVAEPAPDIGLKRSWRAHAERRAFPCSGKQDPGDRRLVLRGRLGEQRKHVLGRQSGGEPPAQGAEQELGSVLQGVG